MERSQLPHVPVRRGDVCPYRDRMADSRGDGSWESQASAHAILESCQKWGRVGFLAPLDRRKRRQRSLRQSRYGDGFNFRYIFTNECSGIRGFHSHILASVPQRLVPDFEAWSQQTLGKLAHHQGTAETVKVVGSHAKNEHDAVERQWHGFRYICKQLEPEPEPKWGIPEEPPQRLRDVLQLWPYQSALPVRLLEGQLTGASRDIGEKAQRDACFLSELTSGDLTRIYDGHELEEYRTRPVTGTPCNPLESRGYFSLSLNWWSSASKLDFRFSSLDFQVWSVDINFCRSSSCSRVRYSSSS